MKKVKSIFRYIFAIVLIVSIVIFTIINILNSTLLDKSFVLKILDETGYYDKVLGYAQNNFENYIIQSGLDKTVIDGIITREDVVNDTQKILNNIYNNIEEKINAENLKTKLQANIDTATQGMLLTTSQKDSLNSFVNEVANEYLNTIAHFDFEKTIFNAYHKLDFIMDVANKAVLIFIGVSIFGLLVVCSRRIYKLFSLFGMSLLSSGAFFIIVNIFINAKVNVQAITILNNAFSFSLREIITQMLNIIMKNGLIMLFVGLALIIASNLIHNFIKYKNGAEK